MASYSDILFGKIALANRLVTSAQLQQILAFPARGALADVLVQRGMLTREQAQRVQRAQALTQFMRAEKIYARILVDRRLVDVAVLRECFARQEQAQHRVRIAQVLMERRLLTAEQNEEVVEEQLHRLAEETARIEEVGLGEVAESDDLNQEIEDLSKIRAAGDLEGSTFRRALGPRGLLDGSGGANGPESRGLKAPVAEPPASPRAERGPAAMPAGGGAARTDPLVGKTIASRYRVLEKVGEGGMGTVYRAEHCLMEKIVALKVLNPSLISSKQSLERFRREIRAASKFQHKNVIQIYDAGEGEGGLFYMAMEFAAGETLEDVLKRDGALPIDRCTRLLRQTLGAIGEAHKKGIVHRDLKSGNIMIVVGKDGDEIVKVMDFGIAKIALESAEGLTESGAGGLYRTQEGVVTGTPQYMSPEQCSGEPVDARADLYSLGVILFEILTGELPFKSHTPMGFLGKHIVEAPPPPSSMRHGLPQVLEDVALRLLEKKPEARFQSAEEVLAALDAGRVARAPERGASDRHPQERSRSGAPRATIAAPGPTIGLTVEVAAPLVDGPGEDFPQAFAPAPTMPVEGPIPQVMPVGPGAGRSRVLVAAAALLLLLVVSVSTTIALVLGGSSDADAAALLLAREAEELAGLVRRADDLAGRWRQTRAIDDAAAAIAAYEAALARRDDAQVRARLEQLRAEQRTPVSEVTPPPTTTSTPPPPPATEAEPPPPPDPLAPARAVLGKLELALRAGKLEEAAAQLAEAEALLPPDHTDLELARRSLGSAQSVEASRAARRDGDLARARGLLEEAIRQQPDRQQQAQLKRDLEELAREEAAQTAQQAAQARRAELEASRDRALEESLQAALALDLDAARAALERAREAARPLGDEAGVRARARGLELLAAVVGQVRVAEEQLRVLVEAPSGAEAPTAARAQAVLTRLEELRAGLASWTADEPLATGLHRRLSEGLARAEGALAELQQPVAAQDERVTRFVRMIARVRELPEQRETRAVVQDRLEKLQQLVEHPVYQGATCPPDDRRWIDERLAHFTARWEVWQDLGPRMIAIPGGAWRSPAGVAHELPEVYYAADAEVTCAQWDEFVRATGRARPRDFPGPTDDPVRMVSLADVEEYCAWRSRRPDGKPRRVEFRLPTDGEWERAARAADGTEYPWGPSFEDWRENYAAVKGVISRVRAFQKDKNEWGLHDLVGNVQELTSTRRDGRLVVKGGSIATTRAAAGASAVALVRPGDEASPTIGLRVFAVERAGRR